MVRAVIIHTIQPGPCHMLHFHQYRPAAGTSSTNNAVPKHCMLLAYRVQSEFTLRAATSRRPYEAEQQDFVNNGLMPEFEQGVFRSSTPEGEDIVVAWMGALNVGFSLVCEPEENQMVAFNVLKLIVKYSQEYCSILSQPTEVLSKFDRLVVVLDKLLPHGKLLFMNNRLIRSLEKELDSLIKNIS